MEHFPRFPRMWRALFKRERVYLLFQATSITRRLCPPLPPSRPSCHMVGAVWWPTLWEGMGMAPTSHAASVL